MSFPVSFSPNDLQQLSQMGSPALLKAVGRAFGLGDAEQQALKNGNLPAWFWVTIGVLGGVVVGIQVQKRFPNKVPEFLGGKQ